MEIKLQLSEAEKTSVKNGGSAYQTTTFLEAEKKFKTMVSEIQKETGRTDHSIEYVPTTHEILLKFYNSSNSQTINPVLLEDLISVGKKVGFDLLVLAGKHSRDPRIRILATAVKGFHTFKENKVGITEAMGNKIKDFFQWPKKKKPEEQ